jgi:hypothetical protein
MMRRFLLSLLLVPVLAACQSQPVTGKTVSTADGSYKSISPVELHAMLESKDFVFVNVHIPFLTMKSTRTSRSCQPTKMPKLSCIVAAGA